MLDKELNTLVAKTIYGHHIIVKDIVGTKGEIIVQRPGYAPIIIDWVNDNALCFQLALDNNISLLMDADLDNRIIATSNNLKTSHSKAPEGYFLVSNTNPGRAIVKCFLLMKGVSIK